MGAFSILLSVFLFFALYWLIGVVFVCAVDAFMSWWEYGNMSNFNLKVGTRLLKGGADEDCIVAVVAWPLFFVLVTFMFVFDELVPRFVYPKLEKYAKKLDEFWG